MSTRRVVEGVSKLGVITTKQLLEDCRLTKATVRALLRAGELERVFKGIYVCAWLPSSWERRALCGLLWLGEQAAISHASAAQLHGLDGFAGRPTAIELSIPHHAINHARRSVVPPGYVVHRTRVPFETEMVGELRVIEVRRTLVDLAATTKPDTLDDALDSAIRTARPGLDGEVERQIGKRRRGREGVGKLLALIDERGGHATGSPLEATVFRCMRRRKLPLPRCQYELFDAVGYVVRADFAWPGHRVALHVDGWKFHRQREQFERDRQLASRLAAMGWTNLWVTARMLRTKQWLDTLTQTLHARAPQQRLL